ncbi:ketosteroid isomerase-like protein [Streptomyces sp. SAI-208]|jgi:ketosteroid isomerase-like protein|uniref:nuclear transport factor 2 family protein n=1 Tax=unclassified Streptomyces TaxID=2593676 RepID=UPI0024739FA1|nr:MULTISPECIES: nuclear transport factor 2 family protein [unclassified Streptomyces]MDH6514582.1 ketosteroid isomerase-like protein [Streptomyces sp. SAI-090]MDH6546762.1 ketosteroid isomerase-like protein [Streptomyces sp. SAI-041]MDH6565868.1 ketosteroid isomerase-like protein [Streptomyces sp. SAI-117]MDH6605424.1 ketosteroid isomerase-like protein [Streptomyces sp. SAI-208]MDH6621335.1 ketosteroid isomerase-like protein [Streptomyces sp. SAI-135]
MGTAAHSGFSTETLRSGVEGKSAANLLSLYADDAEIRVVDRNSQPSHPTVLHGRDQISAMLDDVYSRDMTHKLEQCVMEGDHVAFSESCLYSDGVRVLSESMLTLRDGKIVEQTMIQAWDE